MIVKKSKKVSRRVRHDRVRAVVEGTASTFESGNKFANGSNIEAAQKVGEMVAKKALEAGITTVVFDRGGFLFHGRVKALADAAREAGLKF